jgi:hypothetical protein
MISTIIIGLEFLEKTIMSRALADELSHISKRGTSLRNNKPALCRLAGGGLLATTNPPMAFDVRACVGSNLILFVVIVFAIVIPVVDRRHRLTSTKVKIY